VLLCVLQIAVAQESDTIIINAQEPIRIWSNNATATDDVATTPIYSVVNRRGDPMKATMLSAVFPGGGQIYNRKYWYLKVPVVYAGFGATFYMYKMNSDYYKMYFNGYLDFISEIPERNSYLKFIPPNHAVLNPDTYQANKGPVEEEILRRIDEHKRYRDLSMILAGAWYLIQILEANVAASLMEYDVSDNLELAWSPKMFNLPGMTPFAGLGLRFTLTF